MDCSRCGCCHCLGNYYWIVYLGISELSCAIGVYVDLIKKRGEPMRFIKNHKWLWLGTAVWLLGIVAFSAVEYFEFTASWSFFSLVCLYGLQFFFVLLLFWIGYGVSLMIKKYKA